MLILLPPSEGKQAPTSGEPLDLTTLCLPKLARARARTVKALVALCSKRDATVALATLGLTASQRGEVVRNAALRTAAAKPAGEIYTGVLYEALDLRGLDPAAYAQAERSILVFSGLWGAVRISDRIPAYRCSIGVKLPPLGGLSAFWRQVLAPAMAQLDDGGLVVDLRSGSYAAMWAPPAAVTDRTAVVRILHEREVDGVVVRGVVSHFNKAIKGTLVRDLLVAGARPRTPQELVGALRELRYRVEERPGPSTKPRQLDVVVGDEAFTPPGRITSA